MITLDNDTLVLDRTRDGDDILPLLHANKAKRTADEWYVDLGIASEEVKYLLVDAEVLDEPVAVRYIARDGGQFEATLKIVELISDEEGDRCRLQGAGAPPPVFLADSPQLV